MTARQEQHHLQQQTNAIYRTQRRTHKQRKFRSENSVG